MRPARSHGAWPAESSPMRRGLKERDARALAAIKGMREVPQNLPR